MYKSTYELLEPPMKTSLADVPHDDMCQTPRALASSGKNTVTAAAETPAAAATVATTTAATTATEGMRLF